MTRWHGIGAALVGVVGLLGLLFALSRQHAEERMLIAYSTPLTGRKAVQRHNAQRAAQQLNGAILPPGKTLSFNGTVTAWDNGRFYELAPVSIDGTTVQARGGGVCQTSSTLYNLALLAGLEIVERHHHTVAPHYVPPGRDAAVAYPGIDLRIRNPYPFPLRIGIRLPGDRLELQLWGTGSLRKGIALETQVVSANEPDRVPVRGGRRAMGTAGLRVITYRRSQGTRTRLTDDTYVTVDSAVPG